MALSEFLDDKIRPNDPLRKVSCVRQTRRVRRILNDLQGIGCRVVKDVTKEGHGWRIIVDGIGSDIPFPDGTNPFSQAYSAQKLVFYFRQTSNTSGTWTQGKAFVAGVDTTITSQPTTITTTTSKKYWILHDFAAATMTWNSGTSYPSPSDTQEVYRMCEITCAGGVITDYVNCHACDIHATAKST